MSQATTDFEQKKSPESLPQRIHAREGSHGLETEENRWLPQGTTTENNHYHLLLPSSSTRLSRETIKAQNNITKAAPWVSHVVRTTHPNALLFERTQMRKRYRKSQFSDLRAMIPGLSLVCALFHEVERKREKRGQFASVVQMITYEGRFRTYAPV